MGTNSAAQGFHISKLSVILAAKWLHRGCILVMWSSILLHRGCILLIYSVYDICCILLLACWLEGSQELREDGQVRVKS